MSPWGAQGEVGEGMGVGSWVGKGQGRAEQTCHLSALSPCRLMSSVKDNVGRGLNIALVNGESR